MTMKSNNKQQLQMSNTSIVYQLKGSFKHIKITDYKKELLAALVKKYL
jgi:hypothetical protein